MPDTGKRAGAAMLVPLALATFIATLDNTVVNVALPRIRLGLGLTSAQLEWVVTTYVLVFACLMIPGGRLADLVGRRHVLVAGLVVFGIGSLVAAAAPRAAVSGAAVLIAGRAVQGLGSALVLPASLAVLAADVPNRFRQLGVGIGTAAAAAAVALGPAVGGLVAEYWTWKGIFLLNIPIIGLTCWLTLRTVPRPIATARVRGAGLAGLDPAGVLLSILGTGALTWALIEGTSHGWDDTPIVASGVIGATALVAFVFVESRVRTPLLDPQLFRNAVFSGAVAAQGLWGLGINGVFFFTSLFLQQVLGLSPSVCGLVFVPLAVALILVVPALGPVVRWAGARAVISTGLVLVAAGLLLISSVGRHAGVTSLLPAMIIIGVGSAFTVPLTAVVLDSVPSERTGVAASVSTACREFAGVLGVSVIGAVVLHDRARLLGFGRTPADAFLGGYRCGLQVAAAIALAGALVALITLRGCRRDPLIAAANRSGMGEGPTGALVLAATTLLHGDPAADERGLR